MGAFLGCFFDLGVKGGGVKEWEKETWTKGNVAQERGNKKRWTRRGRETRREHGMKRAWNQKSMREVGSKENWAIKTSVTGFSLATDNPSYRLLSPPFYYFFSTAIIPPLNPDVRSTEQKKKANSPTSPPSSPCAKTSKRNNKVSRKAVPLPTHTIPPKTVKEQEASQYRKPSNLPTSQNGSDSILFDLCMLKRLHFENVCSVVE